MTATLSDPNDAGRGVHLACDVLDALADHEDDRALALMNSATDAEVRWAAATLATAVREAVDVAAGPNPRKRRRALHAAAAGARYQDAVVTAAAVAAQAGERNG